MCAAQGTLAPAHALHGPRMTARTRTAGVGASTPVPFAKFGGAAGGPHATWHAVVEMLRIRVVLYPLDGVDEAAFGRAFVAIKDAFSAIPLDRFATGDAEDGASKRMVMATPSSAPHMGTVLHSPYDWRRSMQVLPSPYTSGLDLCRAHWCSAISF